MHGVLIGNGCNHIINIYFLMLSVIFLLLSEFLVNVRELISNELHSGDLSASCSSSLAFWLTSALITSDGFSEFGLEVAFWRFDFFGLVKVLVSMPESGQLHHQTCRLQLLIWYVCGCNKQASHSFTDTKIQDFSRTFQDPHEKFSRTFLEPMNA